LVQDLLQIDEAESFDALIHQIQGLEVRTNTTTEADAA
jgi:hypothetical protein